VICRVLIDIDGSDQSLYFIKAVLLIIANLTRESYTYDPEEVLLLTLANCAGRHPLKLFAVLLGDVGPIYQLFSADHQDLSQLFEFPPADWPSDLFAQRDPEDCAIHGP